MIRFYCECGKKYKVEENGIGKSIICSTCNKKLKVPMESEPRKGQRILKEKLEYQEIIDKINLLLKMKIKLKVIENILDDIVVCIRNGSIRHAIADTRLCLEEIVSSMFENESYDKSQSLDEKIEVIKGSIPDDIYNKMNVVRMISNKAHHDHASFQNIKKYEISKCFNASIDVITWYQDIENVVTTNNRNENKEKNAAIFIPDYLCKNYYEFDDLETSFFKKEREIVLKDQETKKILLKLIDESKSERICIYSVIKTPEGDNLAKITQERKDSDTLILDSSNNLIAKIAGNRRSFQIIPCSGREKIINGKVDLDNSFSKNLYFSRHNIKLASLYSRLKNENLIFTTEIDNEKDYFLIITAIFVLLTYETRSIDTFDRSKRILLTLFIVLGAAVFDLEAWRQNNRQIFTVLHLYIGILTVLYFYIGIPIFFMCLRLNRFCIKRIYNYFPKLILKIFAKKK